MLLPLFISPLELSPKTVSTTEMFPLWPPFSGKEKFLTGARLCIQAVLQGVPFMGVQVLRSNLILLHEKGSGELQE